MSVKLKILAFVAPLVLMMAGCLLYITFGGGSGTAPDQVATATPTATSTATPAAAPKPSETANASGNPEPAEVPGAPERAKAPDKPEAAEVPRNVMAAAAPPKPERTAASEKPRKPDATAATSTRPASGGKALETKQIGGFTLSCEPGGGGKDCIARQHLIKVITRETVFTWSVGHGPEGRLLAVFHTPTEILLPAGLRFRAGTAAERKLTFRTCDRNRCEAILPLTRDVLDELKSASEGATAVYTTIRGREVTRELSLEGLDKVIASLAAK